MSTVYENWGLRCPTCGSDTGISVEVKAWVPLRPYGTDLDDCAGYDWNDHSRACCDACGLFEAEVRDFKRPSI